MIKDNKQQYSILELPLYTKDKNNYIESNITKRMDIVTRIYNAMRRYEWNKYVQLSKTNIWKNNQKVIYDRYSLGEGKTLKKSHQLTEALKKRTDLLKNAGLTEFSFSSDVKKFASVYSKWVPSIVAQYTIAKPLWAAFQNFLYGDGDIIKYRSFRDTNVLISDNSSGIRFLKNDNEKYYLLLSNRNAKAKELNVFVKGPFTEYDKMMLTNKIKVCKIVRKFEKGKYKFYVQLTLEGIPYEKLDKYGNPKHKRGNGKVGIYIYKDTIFAVSSNKVIKRNLCIDSDKKRNVLDTLEIEIEHLRRINNPQNFNSDGTIKKGIINEDGNKEKLKWIYSNHYKNCVKKKNEINRVYCRKKDILQNQIKNELLSMGDEFIFWNMNFKMRMEKPEYDEENKLSNKEYKRKKDNRKIISDTSPSMLLEKINRTLSYYSDNQIEKIKIPEDMYWYILDENKKNEEKFKGENVTVFNTIIPQGFYRAYIIQFYNKDTENFDREKCIDGFKKFAQMVKNIA